MEEGEVKLSEGAKILLKWVYMPQDFFEEKETSLLPEYDHNIENGEVTVSLDERQNLPGLQEQLQDRLISIFRGAALVSQKRFTLEYSGQETIYPDGQKSVSSRVDSIYMAITMENVDLIVKDRNGIIIADTRQERQNKRRQLSILAAKYGKTDPIVESILSSFEKSLNNPKTELVHLYEIRDALANRFSGEAKAKKELGISKSKWRKLGQLANHEPFNQGRHSGEHISALRDATVSELKEARDIAIEMVIAYLVYLETNSSKLP